MKGKMYVYQPGATAPTVKEYHTDGLPLSDLQTAVGGYVEVVPFGAASPILLTPGAGCLAGRSAMKRASSIDCRRPSSRTPSGKGR
jgi:hypothetical protein